MAEHEEELRKAPTRTPNGVVHPGRMSVAEPSGFLRHIRSTILFQLHESIAEKAVGIASTDESTWDLLVICPLFLV
jgi:hypothetical protein